MSRPRTRRHERIAPAPCGRRCGCDSLHYRWNRRNTTPFTAWIRAVTAAIPERFCSKTAYLYVSAHWLRPQCSRAPENWRFECPPTLETACALMRESNNKHRASTRSKSNSESVDVCRTPRGTNNSGSPSTTEDRSTGGLALPAVPPVTVREPHTDSHRAGVRWNCRPETPNSAVRCRGIPPRLRGGGCQPVTAHTRTVRVRMGSYGHHRGGRVTLDVLRPRARDEWSVILDTGGPPAHDVHTRGQTGR